VVQSSTFKTSLPPHLTILFGMALTVTLLARLAWAWMMIVAPVAQRVGTGIAGSSGLICLSGWLGGSIASDGVCRPLKGVTVATRTHVVNLVVPFPLIVRLHLAECTVSDGLVSESSRDLFCFLGGL
jgi:hypothetical protein